MAKKPRARPRRRTISRPKARRRSAVLSRQKGFSRKRAIQIFTLALGLFAAGIIVLQEIPFRLLAKPLDNAKAIRVRHLEAFLQDREAIQHLTYFHTATRNRDAGPFLNSKVRWYLEDEESPRHLADVKGSPIEVPDDVKQFLKLPVERWMDAADTFDYSPFDFRARASATC